MASLLDELREKIEQALQDLPEDLDREVIRRRFSLEDGRAQSLEEVAKALGISPEEVGRRESAALQLLEVELP